MNRKLHNLVLQSYNKGQLDTKAVEMIADHMNRQSLKQYISLLKQEEKKKQVIVTSPKSLTADDLKLVQAQFPDKKIICVLDPEMINGIQIMDKDTEYEINLNKTFHDIIGYLSNYD